MHTCTQKRQTKHSVLNHQTSLNLTGFRVQHHGDNIKIKQANTSWTFLVSAVAPAFGIVKGGKRGLNEASFTSCHSLLRVLITLKSVSSIVSTQ